jgi:YgiT-type zinc finger domain-containing protein
MGRRFSTEATTMKCVICRHGQTEPGRTTVTLTRGNTTVVFRDVPALICDNCGEEYVDEGTTARLLAIAEDAARSGVLFVVRDYIAA